MNYIVKNITTGKEIICTKTPIDGFDYYSSFIADMLPDTKYKTIVENSRRIIEYTRHIQSTDKSIICTNNPNIDLPQIIDEAVGLAEQIVGQRNIDDAVIIYTEAWFEIGYNESKSKRPFSESDMLDFLSFVENNYYYNSGCWCDCETDRSIQRKDILKLFKEQQSKIIFIK